MSIRLPALAATPLIGFLLVLTACGSPAAPSTSATQSTAAESTSPAASGASVTTDPDLTSPTSTVGTAAPTGPETTSSEAVTAPDDAIGAALDAIVPGLGAAGDGPLTEVCGQLSIGSERWLVETVAAGEYAPYAPDGFISPEDATRIVDAIEPHCG